MALMFPDFKNRHFFWITACGEVASADRDLVKWMKQEKDKAAPIKTARGTGHVKLMLGGRSGNHVHFDVLSPEMVPKKPKEEPRVASNEIRESIGRFLGMEIQANLRGGFQASLQELPESGIIRSLLFQTKIGNVAIKLAGANLSIEGAPVQSISWRAGPKGDIKITIEAELIRTTLSENYLTNAVDTLEQAFSVFVLGKAHNESK